MSEPFIAEIRMFAGNFAPRGWADCNGQLLSIAQNPALFSLLGTTYGGDGRTTFALPNLQGRVPVHVGQGPGLSPVQLGQTFGSETVTLTAAQLPPHTHLIAASLPKAETPLNPTPESLVAFDAEPGSATVSFPTAPAAGAATPVQVVQPSLGMRFIIALEGIYPSRS
jgi:microcystin-dependent protein